MNSARIRTLVFSAMLAATVFVATWIQIPAPLGNVNLGDAAILVGAWLLGGPWSVVACALGAALTDLVSGYAIYAPATLLIKALTTLVASALRAATRRMPAPISYLLAAICAELIMTVGYFCYEGLFLYGFPAAILAIPFNLLQGGVCIAIALPTVSILSNIRTHHNRD